MLLETSFFQREAPQMSGKLRTPKSRNAMVQLELRTDIVTKVFSMAVLGCNVDEDSLCF